MDTTQAEMVSGFWQMQVGEREASLKALEDAIRRQGGNPKKLMDQFRIDPQYAKLVAQAMLQHSHTDASDLVMAQFILGNNIFCPADWKKFYNLKFTKKQRREVSRFPWSKSVLTSPRPFNPGKQIKDTHFAFFGVAGINGQPLTIARWHAIHPTAVDPITGRYLQPRFGYNCESWYKNQPCIDKVALEFKWYLLLKEIVPNSTGREWKEQMKMLPDEYEVPTTIAEVTKNILAFRQLNVFLNPRRTAACREHTSKIDQFTKPGLIFCAGCFDGDGLGDGLLINNWDGAALGHVGIGASRKP